MHKISVETAFVASIALFLRTFSYFLDFTYKGKNDPIYFMDGVHPQHNVQSSYGWIKRGKESEIKSNTGRKRLNINGAIDIDRMICTTVMDDSVNAQSIIKLLKKIERKHKKSEKIYVICDNARYYRSCLVKEYLKDSKIELVFLPPYPKFDSKKIKVV